MSFDLQPIALDPDEWGRVRSAFAREGVDVPDMASGEIEQSGIKARFTYDGSTLRVTVVEKPWLYPEGVVRSHLTEFIENAK